MLQAAGDKLCSKLKNVDHSPDTRFEAALFFTVKTLLEGDSYHVRNITTCYTILIFTMIC